MINFCPADNNVTNSVVNGNTLTVGSGTYDYCISPSTTFKC